MLLNSYQLPGYAQKVTDSQGTTTYTDGFIQGTTLLGIDANIAANSTKIGLNKNEITKIKEEIGISDTETPSESLKARMVNGYFISKDTYSSAKCIEYCTRDSSVSWPDTDVLWGTGDSEWVAANPGELLQSKPADR